MADEGVFEAGYDGDVIPSLPVRGVGSIVFDDKVMRFVWQTDDAPQPSWKKPRKRKSELAFAWEDLIAVTNDPRDPRVILIVVEHEGKDRMVRFRPATTTQAIITELQFMAGGGPPSDFSLEVAPCTGSDCKACEGMREQMAVHKPS
jgi:hypothetical protein